MSWDHHHSLSERLATEAELAARTGDHERATSLYREAGVAESAAFDALSAEKHRTRGITAVSAVALWYKGHNYPSAERLAYRLLAADELPPFARAQLQGLLNLVWAARGAEAAGVRFVPGDVLVSIKGGQVIHGGAPLDPILSRVESIQALMYRVVEMLLNQPLRRRGGPTPAIQQFFRPWLLQAPAGSYQFAVRIQQPGQMGLFESDRPTVERVTAVFFSILRASAGNPEVELQDVVPDQAYREAFLNHSRNLAPTGKTFEWLEVRDASRPSMLPVAFAPETRKQINTALRKVRPQRPLTAPDEPTQIQGTLRAVHLNEDWLEVVTASDPTRSVRIEQIGDVLDDVVGPMLNKRVLVTAVRQGTKTIYRDIELDE